MSRQGPDHIQNLLQDCSSIDWNAVNRRAESHPEECMREYPMVWVDSVLDRIITLNPPVGALIAVIRAYPTALVDWWYSEPLSLACESDASNDVIRTLLQEMKRVCTEDTPDRKFFRKELNPHRVLLECGFWTTTCPLDLPDRVSIFLEELPLDIESMSSDHLEICLQSLFKAEYDKLKLVLMKLIAGTTREDELDENRFLVLHAFLKLVRRAGAFGDKKKRVRMLPDRIDGILKVLTMIKERDPDQFRSRDNDGSLPLHIAATMMHRRVADGRIFVTPQRYNSYTSVMVKFLLHEYPESIGIPDQQGRLPLHIATEQKLPCYDVLVNTEARALTTRCIVTRMYPFQLAALGREDVSVCADAHNEWTGMIYTLLRKTPHLIQDGMSSNNEPWRNSQEYLEIQKIDLSMAQLQARKISLKHKVDAMKEL